MKPLVRYVVYSPGHGLVEYAWANEVNVKDGRIVMCKYDDNGEVSNLHIVPEGCGIKESLP